MLTFKNTNILFACLLVVLIAVDILYDLHFSVFVVLLLLYSVILFYGCYYINSGFFMQVYCSKETPRKEIAISFDDGPVAGYTDRILSILKKHKVEAIFFCIGNRISGNEQLMKQVQAEGHVIGNHSYTHDTFFDLFSNKRMLAEMQLTDDETEKVTGCRPRLFRPPYGVTNPNLAKAVSNGNYIPVGWNVRSLDTVIKNEKKLFEKIMKAIQPGSVYLFHDTSNATIAILDAFIQHVKASGYDIVRPDKMLHLQPYA